uniref:Reverse transcriptase domain-containing protein n=1 Tax=Haemonchus contortus TaxID=6289 RepID=A0A7I4XU34_HAECO
MSSIIEGCRSLGMATREVTGASDLIGTQIVMEINLLEESYKALVDTGSMISIIPIGVLAKAQERGFDVDTLSVVPKAKLRPVFDASNNRMNFEGAVYIQVDTKSGHSGLIPFHISPTKEAEVIIGTNALSRLGVEVSINRECKPKEEVNEVNKGKHVVVMKRLYIPPHSVSLVPVKCEGDLGNDKERVIWPCKRGVEPGVYLIKDRETTILVFNTGTDPLILKEGENVGHWETDKWHDQWGDLNPLLSDEVDHELSGNERLQKLEKLLSANTEAQKLDEEVKLLLKKYQETFSISDRELTQMNLVKMTIDTGECAPIKMRARPVPLGLRPKLKELLTDLLEGKVIEHSKSEWAFPIVLVEKKDGSIRLCVDYRELNKKIKLDAYPLPSIEALLQSLSGKRFFSTLDMCSGYWQIPLADDAKEKSAFATPEGLYQFRVTPFGLSTSPPVFQRLMNTVLGDLLGCEVFCYIDDIMVCTTSKQRHLQLLEEVFQRLTKAGLRLKAQKCHLLKSKVAFLGHVIDGDGVHMDPEKVSVIQDYPVSAANRQATPKLLRYGFLLQKVLLGLLEAGVLSLQSDFVEEVVVLGKGASRSISEDEGHDLLGTSPQTARCGCRQKWY